MKKFVVVFLCVAIAAGVAYYLSNQKQDDGPFAQGYIDKAEEFLEGRYYSKALEQYKMAIDADPSNTDAYVGAAEIYEIKGQYEPAIELLDGIERKVTRPDEIYYIRGKILFDAGDYTAAVKSFKDGYENNSKNWQNVLALVRTNAYMQNKEEDSIDVLKELSNDDSEGWRNYYLTLFSYPDSGEMMSYLNESSSNESAELKSMKDSLMKVVQKVQSDSEDVLQNNTLVAYEYLNADLYQPAIPLLELVIAENDEYYASYLYLGVCYQKLGNIDKALENYEKATTVDAKQLQPWVFLAQAYTEKNDQKNADEAYQEALTLDKTNESVRLDYARALVDFGLYSQAAREYGELIDLNTNKSMDYKIELSELNSGSLNDFETALKLAKEVVEDWEGFQTSEDEFQVRALDALGWAFKQNEQKDEATKYLKRALEADPYQADIYLHLGVIYAEIENFVDAQEYLERAIDLDLVGEISAKASNELDKMINEKDN
ncbi:MAG: tetratricopeptide repeat protein [Patescibacteria group bacterium]|nr:tetratricopeptide repeat protein [Patescibacteria group bacterium]